MVRNSQILARHSRRASWVEVSRGWGALLVLAGTLWGSGAEASTRSYEVTLLQRAGFSSGRARVLYRFAKLETPYRYQGEVRQSLRDLPRATRAIRPEYAQVLAFMWSRHYQPRTVVQGARAFMGAVRQGSDPMTVSQRLMVALHKGLRGQALRRALVVARHVPSSRSVRPSTGAPDSSRSAVHFPKPTPQDPQSLWARRVPALQKAMHPLFPFPAHPFVSPGYSSYPTPSPVMSATHSMGPNGR